MRVCPKCKRRLKLSNYYIRRTGKRLGQYYEKCIECMKERGRTYYYKTREHQLKLVKVRKLRYIKERQDFIAILKSKGCVDCKKVYPPYVMDFDHRDRRSKLSSISYMAIRNTSKIDTILTEIAKCDLVCANCHRIRTYGRLHKPLATVAKMVKADV